MVLFVQANAQSVRLLRANAHFIAYNEINTTVTDIRETRAPTFKETITNTFWKTLAQKDIVMISDTGRGTKYRLR